MLLENSCTLCHKLSPLVCVSRESESYKNHHSTLHRFSSSHNFKTGFSHFRLALHRRKAQECSCKLTNEYYKEMWKANPSSPPLLRNYAKVLHEVKGDISKAEKFYSKAIVAGPKDGEVLSLYAQFIWETHKDEGRAQAYFDQAI
ncbi:hypothetical protein SUGI_1034170 [Cryptomeria japonica]|uniref:uncharacterized protein LOC131049740 n=1 Tax=Cryptomeria japonica TaxID=3369 RepID=UPI0024146CCD|nr:uncharacterized protein LOC131049740 [Cryptomeria japonica]GLJ49021.1 hypothetical protein SUGI_1034170 [Cryptomeria japonica]